MAEHLTYEPIVVTDSGNSELSGTTRVRDIVSTALVTVFLVASSVEAIAVTDNVQVHLSNWGIASTFDSVVTTSSGSTDLKGATKVREFVQTNLSISGPVNYSRAIVDIINVSEFNHRILNPAYTLVSDITYVWDDPGQDQPIAVRDVVTAITSGQQAITLVPDNIATLESVNATLRLALISRSISDNIYVRDAKSAYTPGVDNIFVRENVSTSLYGALIIVNKFDSIGISETLAVLRNPIHPANQSNSSVVSDLAIGFLSSPQPQTKVIVDNIAVSENIIRKHSHLTVFVYDTIGVTDRKVPGNREYWWKYSWRWRG